MVAEAKAPWVYDDRSTLSASGFSALSRREKYARGKFRENFITSSRLSILETIIFLGKLFMCCAEARTRSW